MDVLEGLSITDIIPILGVLSDEALDSVAKHFAGDDKTLEWIEQVTPLLKKQVDIIAELCDLLGLSASETTPVIASEGS